MSYIDVCEEKLLEPFYRKLVLLEKMFNVNKHITATKGITCYFLLLFFNLNQN